jgi:hypothetical protein
MRDWLTCTLSLSTAVNRFDKWRRSRTAIRLHRAAGAAVSIAQFGSTRSVNAGVAAGLAVDVWGRRHVCG